MHGCALTGAARARTNTPRQPTASMQKIKRVKIARFSQERKKCKFSEQTRQGPISARSRLARESVAKHWRLVVLRQRFFRGQQMNSGRSSRVSAGSVSVDEDPGTQKRASPLTKAEPSLRNARLKLVFERAMHSSRSESSERGGSDPRLMRAVVDSAVRQRRLWRAHSSSALGLGTPLDFKRQDLKRFYPNVVRRVHGE